MLAKNNKNQKLWHKNLTKLGHQVKIKRLLSKRWKELDLIWLITRMSQRIMIESQNIYTNKYLWYPIMKIMTEIFLKNLFQQFVSIFRVLLKAKRSARRRPIKLMSQVCIYMTLVTLKAIPINSTILIDLIKI